MQRNLLLLLLFLILPAVGWPASASGRDPKYEAAIEQQLRAQEPSLVPALRSATAAFDAQNYPEAERQMATIQARLPNWDVAARRLGSARVMLGQRANGIALIEHAVALNRSYENLISLAYALSLSPAATTGEEDRALGLLAECEKLPQHDEFEVQLIRAQIYLGRRDYEAAQPAVEALRTQYPDKLPSRYYSAILAANSAKWNRAVREIRAAEKLGLDAGTVQKFLDSGVQSRANMWLFAGSTIWAVALWAVGLVGLCGLGYGLSRVTLRQIEKSDVTVPITPGEHRLRWIYRQVLNLAGIYYYISLPVVIMLVLAVAAAVVVGIYMIGFIAIKLFIIFGIGAVVTIISMIRSLFVRVKASDPGRALARSEAEGLWQLAEEVARAVDTRPVDEIRLTVGTDLCVYERGSWREKLRNRARRILVIGTAVLDGFKQEDFRCVLAHEYGHFSNRDTAGGDIAMRVQSDMLKFYYAMAQAGQATRINIAFQFLRAYHFIFRRISRGATRLQEVLADRVAAQLYGPLAFEGGLTHVIRQSLEFESRAHQEIQSAIAAKRPLQNFYDRALPAGPDVENAYKKAMGRGTTADDTHPAPMDRFRLIARIPEPSHPASSGMVWDLFKDRQAIVTEMLASVEKNIARHRG